MNMFLGFPWISQEYRVVAVADTAPVKVLTSKLLSAVTIGGRSQSLFPVAWRVARLRCGWARAERKRFAPCLFLPVQPP